MDLLPIKSNGHKVCTEFWKRFCTGVADAFIITPFVFLFVWLGGMVHSKHEGVPSHIP